MPVQVSKRITVGGLHVGDVVTSAIGRYNNIASHHLVVTSINKKSVWAEVAVETPIGSRHTERARLDSYVTVTREEETAEEIAAHRREVAVNLLRRLWVSINEDPSVALVERIAKNRDDGYAELLGYYDLDKFLEAQALRKIGSTITHLMKVQRENGFDGNNVDDYDDALLVEAFATWYHSEVFNASQYARSPLSRSTSITSNLYEDLDAYAVKYVIEQLRWTGRVVQDRAEELRLAAKEQHKNNWC
jgi:hypothetical protein